MKSFYHAFVCNKVLRQLITAVPILVTNIALFHRLLLSPISQHSVLITSHDDVSWARNDRVFSRYWRTELDQDMIDRADMVQELIMIRDGVLSGSVDFTPEDVQTLVTLLSAD